MNFRTETILIPDPYEIIKLLLFCGAGGEPCGQNEQGPKKTVDVRTDRRHVPAAGVQDAHVSGP